MIIIGITGPIGHGKTTLADALCAKVVKCAQFESSQIIAEVADALHVALDGKVPDKSDTEAINEWLKSLPAILLEVAHIKCRFDQLSIDDQSIKDRPLEYQKLMLHLDNLTRQPELAGQQITPDNKQTYRPFLQWLGGYLVQKAHNGIWYEEIVRRMRAIEPTGVELSVAAGIRFPQEADIIRGAGGTVIEILRPEIPVPDISDPTERQRQQILTDTQIINNGTLEELSAAAESVLYDLRNHSLKTQYDCAKR